MKRICICCGEAMTTTGLNPNLCLDCDAWIELPGNVPRDELFELDFTRRLINGLSEAATKPAEPEPVIDSMNTELYVAWARLKSVAS